jgi:hypothetical protein
VIGEFVEQRAQDGVPAGGLVLEQLIEIGAQLVAQADVVGENLEGARIEGPRLLARRSSWAAWLRQNGNRKPAFCQSRIRAAVVLPAKPPMSGPLNGTPDRARFSEVGMAWRRWW